MTFESLSFVQFSDIMMTKCKNQTKYNSYSRVSITTHMLCMGNPMSVFYVGLEKGGGVGIGISPVNINIFMYIYVVLVGVVLDWEI